MSISTELVYGSHSSQFYRLYKPEDHEDDHLLPVCVLIHGGFFKSKYHIDNSAIDYLIPSLLQSNIAVCLVEYRRVGDGGGFPSTNYDILSALNHLSSHAYELGMDTTKIILVGHSAGGTLALWACCEPPVAELSFKPLLCIAIAPIGNLIEGQLRRLSDEGDAIEKYVGESLASLRHGSPSAYDLASPHRLTPPKVALILSIYDSNDQYFG